MVSVYRLVFVLVRVIGLQKGPVRGQAMRCGNEQRASLPGVGGAAVGSAAVRRAWRRRSIRGGAKGQPER